MTGRYRLEVGGSESEAPGTVHLSGLDAHDHATFCGLCWPRVDFADHPGPLTCRHCIAAVIEARKLLRGVRIGAGPLPREGSP